MIVCVSIPRFELAVAAGGRRALMGEPAALAPRPGGEAVIGEVSAAAEAFGVAPGMRLGEALARCPELTLVPPDPAGVADAWERMLVRLEGMGAGVESARPGLVRFPSRVCHWGSGGSSGMFLRAGARRGPLTATSTDRSRWAHRTPASPTPPGSCSTLLTSPMRCSRER